MPIGDSRSVIGDAGNPLGDRHMVIGDTGTLIGDKRMVIGDIRTRCQFAWLRRRQARPKEIERKSTGALDDGDCWTATANGIGELWLRAAAVGTATAGTVAVAGSSGSHGQRLLFQSRLLSAVAVTGIGTPRVQVPS